MSMPPMSGPPSIRMPLAAQGAPQFGTPGTPPHTAANQTGSPPPQVMPTASSKRRAYPTAHLAANSISYSGGFDAGAHYSAAATAAPGAADGLAVQPQLFTPGVPDAVSPGQGQAQPPAPAPSHPYSHHHAPSAAPAVGGYGQNGAAFGGVNAMASQFQGMALGGAKGNPLVTVNLSGSQPNVNDLERPPPEIRLPPNACISTNPKANADPSYQRCTLNAVPTTSSLLTKSRLPLGLVLSPYRSVREEDRDEPVPVVSDTVIARCRRCRTYINPYVQFIEGGNRWKCCMCNISNEVPQLFDWDQEKNQPADRWSRPELNHSVVEFIAPREYMVRPPQPPVYVFLIDVSIAGVASGMAATAARTILESLDRLPNQDNRTKVALIAVDTSLHFFCLPVGVTEPEMLVVSDLDDVFLPKPNDILVNLTESRAGFESLLTRLGDMFKDNTTSGSAMGAALQAAYKLVSPIGGKIITLTASLPSVGPGALKVREDPKLLGTSKESSLLGAASTFYKTFPIDCSRSQVSVDMFLFASGYTDVATLSCLPRYTGGQTYFYKGFSAARSEDALKFAQEFGAVLSSPIAYEAVLRLRCTKGLRATQFYGNFFVRSTDLLALPAVPLDQSYAIECEIEETINAPFVVFQSVVLHSTSYGERRIRVVNLALPTTSSMSEVYSSADQIAIASLLASKAVERSIHARLEDARDALMNKLVDVFSTYKSTMTSAGSGASPQLSISSSMALLPLLVLGMLKNIGLRASAQIPPDLRSYAQALLTTMPSQQLIPYIHPNLYALHSMPPETGTRPEGGALIMPPKLSLTSELFERHGLFLIENGQTIFIWLGRDAVPQLCLDVFDAPNYTAVQGGKTTLPRLDNSMSQRVNAIVEHVQTCRRGVYRPDVYVVKEDGEPGLRLWALSMLILDRYEQTPSYQQLLGMLRDRVNGGS